MKARDFSRPSRDDIFPFDWLCVRVITFFAPRSPATDRYTRLSHTSVSHGATQDTKRRVQSPCLLIPSSLHAFCFSFLSSHCILVLYCTLGVTLEKNLSFADRCGGRRAGVRHSMWSQMKRRATEARRNRRRRGIRRGRRGEEEEEEESVIRRGKKIWLTEEEALTLPCCCYRFAAVHSESFCLATLFLLSLLVLSPPEFPSLVLGYSSWREWSAWRTHSSFPVISHCSPSLLRSFFLILLFLHIISIIFSFLSWPAVPFAYKVLSSFSLFAYPSFSLLPFDLNDTFFPPHKSLSITAGSGYPFLSSGFLFLSNPGNTFSQQNTKPIFLYKRLCVLVVRQAFKKVSSNWSLPCCECVSVCFSLPFAKEGRKWSRDTHLYALEDVLSARISFSDNSSRSSWTWKERKEFF